MSSKNLWLLASGALWSLSSLGMLAEAWEQRAQEPGASGASGDVRLGFETSPPSAGPAGPAGGRPAANNGRYFGTHEASIIGPVPTGNERDASGAHGPALGLADGQSLQPGSDGASRGTAATTPPGPAAARDESLRTRRDGPGVDAPGRTRPMGTSRLTMWITMGLFASLAANVFFAWVAWDTHVKFQDLVAGRGDHDLTPRRQARETGRDGRASSDPAAAVASREPEE